MKFLNYKGDIHTTFTIISRYVSNHARVSMLVMIESILQQSHHIDLKSHYAWLLFTIAFALSFHELLFS
jgi:hypothetical protein